jgi:hypothetical protein
MDIRPLHAESNWGAPLGEVPALIDLDPGPGTQAAISWRY